MKDVNKSIFVFVVITICILSCNTNKEKVDNTIISSKEVLNFPIIDQYFNRLDNFSGNVLVAFDGKPIFKKSYGFANIELNVTNNPETKFRIGSVTKQFTAIAIMILQEQGKLNVNHKISKYFSDIPEIWKEITVHQLLTHTSGIMNSWELEGFEENMMLYASIESVINQFKDQPLIGTPGEKFQYSGTGYYILSTLIQKVSGKSYENFLKDEIFNKIGMTNSGSDIPRKIIKNRASGYTTDSTGMNNSTYIYMPRIIGSGNLYSTTEDLLKWDQSLYNNTLISKESKEKMFTPELNDYAYGWTVIKRDTQYVTTHNGGVPGFLTKISRFPNNRLLVVILSNNWRSENPEMGQEFVDLISDELNRKGYNTIYSKLGD